MSRFARDVFAFCSAVSLALFVAVAVVVGAAVAAVRGEYVGSLAVSRDTYFAVFQDGCLWLVAQEVTRGGASTFSEADTSRLHEIAVHRLGVETLLRTGMPGGSRGMRTVSGFDAWHLSADAVEPPSDGGGWVAVPARGAATGVHRFTYSGLALPYWSALMGAALLPVLYLGAARRRAARRAQGLCDVCGYDLRASPGRCPECGAGRRRSGRR